MGLTGRQYDKLVRALCNAFPTTRRFEMMLKSRVDRNMEMITTADGLEAKVFEVVKSAEAEDWTAELVNGARESNPRNRELLAFIDSYGKVTTPMRGDALERLINELRLFVDVAIFRERLAQIENQICRIEVPLSSGETVFGTAFLIAPDLVMTNHHVIASMIAGEISSTTTDVLGRREDVALRFDYKRLADRSRINEGTVYRLASDWLVDASPPSIIDSRPEPKQGTPADDELDYAVLRIAGEPGNERVGANVLDLEAPTRGWQRLPAVVALSPGDPVFVVQHPSGGPLVLDVHRHRGTNGNATRITYTTNTEHGSSGSPCFNGHWDLVALHHSGNPLTPETPSPEYNEGIPIDKIRALLVSRGKGALLVP